MSIFSKIKDAIFARHAEAHEAPGAGAATASTQGTMPAAAPTGDSASAATPAATGATPSAASMTAPQPASAPSTSGAAAAATAGSAPAAGAASASPSSSTPVDVAAVMDRAVAKHGQKLDWRHSIVDMMKALDLDSSLADRKELAQELNYTGDTDDSATMNVWLHKALMKKLAENGGRVPAELTD